MFTTVRSTDDFRSISSLKPLQHARDRDLIFPDEYLTNTALDELWDWYSEATTGSLDPQLVFVKIVNSVRKPYREQLSLSQQGPPGNMGNFGSYGSRSSACYTPSNCTIMGEKPDTPRAQNDKQMGLLLELKLLQEKLADMERVCAGEKKTAEYHAKRCTYHEKRSKHLDERLAINEKALEEYEEKLLDLEKKLSLKESQSKSKEIKAAITEIAPTRIALHSVAFTSRYVQLCGDGATSFGYSGRGWSGIQDHIGTWETFELIRHAEGVYSFKSTAFENVYLRAEAGTLQAGAWSPSGAGTVNAQYGCGTLEKFRIRPVRNGKVTVEPLEYPGRYLSLNADRSWGVHLQGKVADWELFYLVYVL